MEKVLQMMFLILKKWLTHCMGIMLCTFLCGCASSDHFSLVFKSDQEINPDINGRSSPLDVHVYQLIDSKKFMQVNFFDLYNDAKLALGEDLLEERRLEIKPNQEVKIDFPDNLKSKDLGFLFAYHDLEGAKWREVVTQSNNSPLYIDLKARDFHIQSSASETTPANETKEK